MDRVFTLCLSAVFSTKDATGQARNSTSGLPHVGLPISASKAAPRVTLKNSRSKASQAEIEELLSQIGRDLKPWQESGVSLEMVEKAYCTEEIGESMRFQVEPTALFSPSRLYLRRHLLELSQIVKLLPCPTITPDQETHPKA